MKKKYVTPETETFATPVVNLLQSPSKVQTEDVTGEEKEGPGMDDDNKPFGARQHNNWMWDTMEDEF